MTATPAAPAPAKERLGRPPRVAIFGILLVNMAESLVSYGATGSCAGWRRRTTPSSASRLVTYALARILLLFFRGCRPARSSNIVPRRLSFFLLGFFVDRLGILENLSGHRRLLGVHDRGLPCASLALPTALGLRIGGMTGYADSPAGYPANMQPALAAAVDAGVAGAADA